MFLRRRYSQNHDREDDSSQKEEKNKELRRALGALAGRSLKYCSDACLKRYLEARNWNVDKAKKMLEDSLSWRSTYKPEEILWNTNSPENNIRHLVYLIENGIINLPEGQEQMSWLIDFTGFSFSTNIQVKTARDIINILQSHYPERLAICLLYNPPRIFQAFFKAVRYFIDPKTSQKVKFVYPNNKESVELMKTFFDIDNLPREFGGKATLKYDHEQFSRMMAEDDIKTAKFWEVDEKSYHMITNGDLGTEVAQFPISV